MNTDPYLLPSLIISLAAAIFAKGMDASAHDWTARIQSKLVFPSSIKSRLTVVTTRAMGLTVLHPAAGGGGDGGDIRVE